MPLNGWLFAPVTSINGADGIWLTLLNNYFYAAYEKGKYVGFAGRPAAYIRGPGLKTARVGVAK